MPQFRSCVLLVACLVIATEVPPAHGQPPDADRNRSGIAREPARTDLYGDPLPDGVIARLGTLRFRTGTSVTGTVFSPDGQILAAVSDRYGHPIYLFDAATGRVVRRIRAEARDGLAFTPDGRSIACVGDGQLPQLWDTTTGKLLRQFDAPESKVCCIALSADGRTLASGDEGTANQSVLYAWDVDTGQRLARFKPLHNSQVHVALSPDGKVLASWGYQLKHLPQGETVQEPEGGRTIQLWHILTGKEIGRLKVKSGQKVDRVAFSPEGKSLAAVSRLDERNRGRDGEERAIYVWQAPFDKQRLRFAVPARMDFPMFTFSPDGRILAAGVEEKAVSLWEAATGKRLGPFPMPDCPCPHWHSFPNTRSWPAASRI
jgi:WD40 repeat protein